MAPSACCRWPSARLAAAQPTPPGLLPLALQVLDWDRISLHVPPVKMPQLSSELDRTDARPPAETAAFVPAQRRSSIPALPVAAIGSGRLSPHSRGATEPLRVLSAALLPSEAGRSHRLGGAHFLRQAEKMREAGAGVRRRLLWTSVYGSCHLAPGEGGTADAFDTLMEVLRRPRAHFKRSLVHQLVYHRADPL